MGEPVVLVRSRVLRGLQCDERGVAAAAGDLSVLLRADAQRFEAEVDVVSEARVEGDDFGAWVRVTRTATGHRRF